MKRISLSIIAVLLVTLFQSLAGGTGGGIEFENIDVQKILAFYADYSGLKLVTSSDVKKLHPLITVHGPAEVSKAENLKLIRKALIQQAGVVVTPLDEKTTSVTYNDQLPVSKSQ